jgi:hypothetical protein
MLADIQTHRHANYAHTHTHKHTQRHTNTHKCIIARTPEEQEENLVLAEALLTRIVAPHNDGCVGLDTAPPVGEDDTDADGDDGDIDVRIDAYTNASLVHPTYAACHVDKCNVGYFDYSALVYLSTFGVDFEGGRFAFKDAMGDEIVEPKAGRCVLFASGPEHLHQVQTVTGGTRKALALWFSLGPEKDILLEGV